MHVVGLHSALAIKRQRKCRDEQRRARERRYSSQSGESGVTSPRTSTVSLDQRSRSHRKIRTNKRTVQGIESKVVTSIGMLHIGIVFLVSGGFLLISGLLPSDATSNASVSLKSQWNELIAVGLLLIIIGCILMFVNSIIAKSEEKELEQYVHRQLIRSKSGHRLERDVETGGLSTRHAKRAKTQKKFDSSDASKIKIHSPSQINTLSYSRESSSNQNSVDNESHAVLAHNEKNIIKLKNFQQNCSHYKLYAQPKVLPDNSFKCSDSCKVQIHHSSCEISNI